MNRKTKKKIIRILISLFSGAYVTATMYSFFYCFITGNITYLLILGTPLLVVMLAFCIYGLLKEGDYYE